MKLCHLLAVGFILSSLLVAALPAAKASPYALSFDGINDYVDCGVKSDFDLAGTALSIEVKVKAENQSSYAYILARNLNVGTSGFQYGLWLGSSPTYDYIWSEVENEGWGFPLKQLPHNQWTHIVFTFSSPTWNLYIDGTLVKTKSLAATITTKSFPLYIGARNDNGAVANFFCGLIRNVRLYNRALNSSEVLTNMGSDSPITDGLVLSYPMNEGSGTTVHDESGKNNDGTIYGATWVDLGSPAPSNTQTWIGISLPHVYAAITVWSLALIVGVGAAFMTGDVKDLPYVILIGLGILVVLFVSLTILSAFGSL